jgi:hypothetical protein
MAARVQPWRQVRMVVYASLEKRTGNSPVHDAHSFLSL